MSLISRRIKLNVGGQLFETTIGTLKRLPDTSLSRIVDDEWESFNSYEPIFIDHNARHFNQVLNFLRDGYIPLPDDPEEIDQIRREAEYFEIRPLVEFIEAEEQRGPPFFRGDKVIWRDANLHRALSSRGWCFDGTTDEKKIPLCFKPESDEPQTCGLCGTSTEDYDENYRSVFSKQRHTTFNVGEVHKVYGDCCCVDVTFSNYIYVFHIPSKMLKLVGVLETKLTLPTYDFLLCSHNEIMLPNKEDRIRINVGGKQFSTTVGVLSSARDSVLALMVNPTWLAAVGFDPIYVDRDPTYFQDIIDYLDKGSIELVNNRTTLERIKQEAEFYQLDSLISYIDREERRCHGKGPLFFPKERVVWRSRDFTKMFRDSGWTFDSNTKRIPLGFSVKDIFLVSGESMVCPLCRVSTEEFNGLYKNLLDFPRTFSLTVAEVSKIYGDCCCIDVTFGQSSFIFHLPTKMFKLAETSRCEKMKLSCDSSNSSGIGSE